MMQSKDSVYAVSSDRVLTRNSSLSATQLTPFSHQQQYPKHSQEQLSMTQPRESPHQ
ncbi:MAG: hypothetical protein ACM37W_05930 [Actinomycetota bacterium]